LPKVLLKAPLGNNPQRRFFMLNKAIKGFGMQLVINSPGTFITQKDECFRLKQKERVFDISPLKVESIIISNQAMISTQAIAQALEHNIDIIFLDSYGDPLGRVWFSKMGSTALIRRRQLEAAAESLGVQLVIDMIRQKMENQTRLLKAPDACTPRKKRAVLSRRQHH